MKYDVRGELHCMACSRYLGEFESHPSYHGERDLHLLEPEFTLENRAIETESGLRCSRCGGRVMTQHIERLTAA